MGFEISARMSSAFFLFASILRLRLSTSGFKLLRRHHRHKVPVFTTRSKSISC
jgi:hypothetical protein